MIVGIGVDAVEISRFEHWCQFKHKTLLKIFTDAEIEYCLSVKKLSAQRFAARFAAKEAIYKAVGSSFNSMTFIKFCKKVEIQNDLSGKPLVKFLYSESDNMKIELSITHTKSTAIAFIITHSTLLVATRDI